VNTDQAKTGIFIGSGVAGVLGFLTIRVFTKPRPKPDPGEAQVPEWAPSSGARSAVRI